MRQILIFRIQTFPNTDHLANQDIKIIPTSAVVGIGNVQDILTKDACAGCYRNPAFLQFIQDVPVDWEFTRVPHAQIGDYITIVRKDRNSPDWYVGSITDENARELELPLSFLDGDRKYVAEIYSDTPDTHWEANPLAIEIRQLPVTRETILKLNLAPGGGQAVRLQALE